MKKVTLPTVIAVSLLVLILVLPLGACVKPTPASSPSPSLKATPGTALAPATDPLAQIIEGAKKEGIVTGRLGDPEFGEIAVTTELQRAIKDKYGVDLKISFPRGSVGTAQMLATAIMEYKTGVTPAYDLLSLPSAYVSEAIASDAIEKVDWSPLTEKGLPPEIVPQEPRVRGAIFYKNSYLGLVYNPKKVSKAEAPKTISDLADPKWRGRLGLANTADRWVEWAFVLGKDKVFSLLRSLVKTKPLLDSFSSLDNRFTIGEIDLVWTITSYMGATASRGVPIAFQSLDFSYQNLTYLVVPKKVTHPNAAKLVSIFLASSDGTKFMIKNIKGGGRKDIPGSMEYDIYQDDLKRGLLVYNPFSYPGMLDFMVSPDREKWAKEAELILKGQ
ncbi:MAG: ABC transporter substrate-binding protein [Chloroflexi bacterium]|nr:ABC transporter substrate-binding protein [Chloroflexota bacterium]